MSGHRAPSPGRAGPRASEGPRSADGLPGFAEDTVPNLLKWSPTVEVSDHVMERFERDQERTGEQPERIVECDERLTVMFNSATGKRPEQGTVDRLHPRSSERSGRSSRLIISLPYSKDRTSPSSRVSRSPGRRGDQGQGPVGGSGFAREALRYPTHGKVPFESIPKEGWVIDRGSGQCERSKSSDSKTHSNSKLIPKITLVPVSLMTCSLDLKRRVSDRLVCRQWQGLLFRNGRSCLDSGPRNLLVALARGSTRPTKTAQFVADQLDARPTA